MIRDIIRKRRTRLQEDKGFTLIELMVVVLIIGILMAIAIPTYLGAQTSAQDRAVQSDLRNLITSEVSYYTQNQTYASGAQLISQDPAYTSQLSGTPTISVTFPSTGGATAGVCISEKSKSGTNWGIEEVATGATAGAWYANDTSGAVIACGNPSALAQSLTNPEISQVANSVGW